MSGAIITAWLDMQGRVWLETGHLHPKTKEPLIELLNGAARGALSWVDKEFGPLEQLGVQRRSSTEAPRRVTAEDGPAR
ncbi:hypothetical protein ACIBP6_43095 [Nonomuraea terrae]|uniref:hypothetical protein n=1 Tax=Nonomuraea terrae TaxID=2530383 RepID=UPI0037949317